MELRKRLFNHLFPVVIAFLLLAVVSALLVLSINQSAREIVYESDPPIKVMEYFLLDILNDNLFLGAYLEIDSYNDTVDFDRRLQVSYERDLEVKREIESLIASGDFDNQRVVDYYLEAKTVHDQVILKRNALITLHRESLITGSDVSSQKQRLLVEHEETFESARARLSQIINQINLDREEVQRSLVFKIRLYSVLLLLSLFAFVALLVFRIIAFSNEIINPLERIMGTTKDFVRGDHSARTATKSRISEIKSLEKNINDVFRAVDDNLKNAKKPSNSKSTLLGKEYHEVLDVLKSNVSVDKQTTISDLKRSLGVTHPTILARLKYLELNGYIRIVKSGREKYVELV